MPWGGEAIRGSGNSTREGLEAGKSLVSSGNPNGRRPVGLGVVRKGKEWSTWRGGQRAGWRALVVHRRSPTFFSV